ncbi:pyridoxal phosphate-dependent decarboxylase family protein [Dactylosporangium vinaceum]|uniref:Pyridoxal phosphate-dependent decarboxylase family protein n=1 Tax=Dactylosporangium vinaceum TaxID=53362 RepID=A0ABV5M4Y2_9ACTN
MTSTKSDCRAVRKDRVKHLSALPEQGRPAQDVLAELRDMRGGDLPTHGGRLFAYVYDAGLAGLDDLAAAAHALSAHVNGLDPTAFPSLLAMENDLVAAAAQVLGGDEDTVGSVTSGGTESLILAVKAARDSRPDIARPRLVMPVTAHAALAKAASYLRVELDTVPVDPVSLRVDPAAVAAAITPDTVLVACSAPSYAHGLIDPVEPIAAAAAANGVRCHVDACFGGWTLPYLRRLGEPIPPFDLSVPGVTSISVDLHKYAYVPKGVSVLLHRDESLRMPQYFGYADWPGYTMVNPVISSTRSGGPIAAAWATLRHIGDDGYLALAAKTRDATRAIGGSVARIADFAVIPRESTVVAFMSSSIDLFVLADELAARGWHTQPQFRHGAIPASVHLTVTAAVAPRVGEFEADFAAAVEAARAHGPIALPDGILDLLETAPVEQIAGALGLGAGGGLPDRMAPVNSLLNAVAPAVREKLLIAFLSLLQRPSRRP